MARLVYFVLAVDLDEETAYIYDDTFTARFSSSQQVWDTDLEEWRNYEGYELENAQTIVVRALNN